MNSKLKSIIFLNVVFFIICGFSVRKEEELPKDRVKRLYLQKVQELEADIRGLSIAVVNLNGEKKNYERLLSKFCKSRITYKELECISAYFDSYSSFLLNGNVYQAVEKYGESEPSGFHVLEKLIFSDNRLQNKSLMLNEINKFHYSLKELSRSASSLALADKLVFDAFKQHVIRVNSIDLTGSDSPFALHSLAESKASLQALQKYLSCYYPLLSEKNKQLKNRTEKRFSSAVKFLKKEAVLENFDRVNFTKKYLLPIYEDISNIQEALKIDSSDKDFFYATPANSRYRNFFDKDFDVK